VVGREISYSLSSWLEKGKGKEGGKEGKRKERSAGIPSSYFPSNMPTTGGRGEEERGKKEGERGPLSLFYFPKVLCRMTGEERGGEGEKEKKKKEGRDYTREGVLSPTSISFPSGLSGRKRRKRKGDEKKGGGERGRTANYLFMSCILPPVSPHPPPPCGRAARRKQEREEGREGREKEGERTSFSSLFSLFLQGRLRAGKKKEKEGKERRRFRLQLLRTKERKKEGEKGEKETLLSFFSFLLPGPW